MTKLDAKYQDERYLNAITRYKIANAIKSKANKFLKDNIDTMQIVLDLIAERNFDEHFYTTIEYKVNSFYNVLILHIIKSDTYIINLYMK